MSETEEQPVTASTVEIKDVDVADAKPLVNSKSFSMSWVDHEGRSCVGTFTAQRPTLAMVGQIAILKAQLNGGQRLDAQTDFMHEMLALLRVTLKTSPAEWLPEDLFDPEPLRRCYSHVRSWLETFRR